MAKKLDITKHTHDELMKLVSDKQEALRVLRFGSAGSKNKDVKAASKLRKDIARALTRLNLNTKSPKV